MHSSEGIQVGSVRSAYGVLGSWTTTLHEQGDPVGGRFYQLPSRKELTLCRTIRDVEGGAGGWRHSIRHSTPVVALFNYVRSRLYLGTCSIEIPAGCETAQLVA